MRYLVFGLAVAFTVTAYSHDRPSLGHSIREKIEVVKGQISQTFGYTASCLLDDTGLEGCVTGLQKLQFALKAPATKGKDFSHIILTNHYATTSSAGGHVVIDANGSIRDIQNHLSKQRNADAKAVVEETKLAAAFDELQNRFNRRTGYEAFCNGSELKPTGCLKALQAVDEATSDQNTVNRDFRSVYLTNEFQKTDIEEHVWVNGRSSVSAIRSHLVKQRLASDPEVEFERSLRQEIAKLRSELTESSGHTVICQLHATGLEKGLEGLQNLSIALSDIPMATERRYTIFIGNETTGPTINRYVTLDYRLSIHEMRQHLRRLH